MKAALTAGEPAISVDTKKKELVGDVKNAGREWRPKGKPVAVRVHDFLIRGKGRAVPYGIYDVGENTGWVSVGIEHDTASLRVNAIRRWWQLMVAARYPNAKASHHHRRQRRRQWSRAAAAEAGTAEARRRA